MEDNTRLRKLLKRPLMTEKVVRMQETTNTWVFEVPTTANKIEIKRAVEEILEVTVTGVRTVNQLGKLKRLGRFVGRRSSWKKAYVTLQQGDTLELYKDV